VTLLQFLVHQLQKVLLVNVITFLSEVRENNAIDVFYFTVV
jgi:hypothetical protein